MSKVKSNLLERAVNVLVLEDGSVFRLALIEYYDYKTKKVKSRKQAFVSADKKQFFIFITSTSGENVPPVSVSRDHLYHFNKSLVGTDIRARFKRFIKIKRTG